MKTKTEKEKKAWSRNNLPVAHLFHMAWVMGNGMGILQGFL